LEAPKGFERSKPPSRSKPVPFQPPKLVDELQSTSTKPQTRIKKALQPFSSPFSEFPTSRTFSNETSSNRKNSASNCLQLAQAKHIVAWPSPPETSEKLEKPDGLCVAVHPTPQVIHTEFDTSNLTAPSDKRVLQPPALCDVFKHNKPLDTTRYQLRPPLALEKPPSSASSRLFQLPAPPLKEIHAEIEPDRYLRTISSTSFARATDLTTDGGNAELAHIFLQDQYPNLTTATQNWSIGLSPHKKENRRSKEGGRFVR
jgi:hypothetical protein